MDDLKIPAHLTIEELAKLIAVWEGIVGDYNAMLATSKAEFEDLLVNHRRATAHLERLRDRCFHFDEGELVDA